MVIEYIITVMIFPDTVLIVTIPHDIITNAPVPVAARSKAWV